MITNELMKDIKMGMNIIDGEEYKDILEGITQITCEIITKTLGPYASTTVIDDGISTYSTKDGWSIVNRIRFGDTIENTLFKFIKDISFTLNSKVGDGTTTAIVAANKFITEFRSWIDKQRTEKGEFQYIRQADLLEAIEKTAKLICDELKSESRLMRVSNPSDIYKIANISTNGNETISNIIKEIYSKTENPNIHVTLSIGEETHYEIVKGYKLDTTLLNPNYHYNTSEETCVIDGNCKIAVFNHTLTYVEHYKLIQDLINSVCNQSIQSTLVVVAPFFDDVFTSVASASIRQIVNGGQRSPFILVQAPVANTLQKCFLNDFAVLCGTEVFDYSRVKMYNQMNKAIAGESSDYDEYATLREVSEFKTPEDILKASIGYANKLTIGKNFILLENFDQTTTLYKNTLKFITDAYEEAKAKVDSSGNRLALGFAEAHLRYVKFLGVTGTIFVGGESELSCKCLKDAVDDAVLACKSAYENGFIRGMNIETISAINDLVTVYTEKSNNASAEFTKLDMLSLACLKMFGRVFSGVTREIMYNKYKEDGFTFDDFGKLPWDLTYTCGNECTNKKAKKQCDKINNTLQSDPLMALLKNGKVDYCTAIISLCAKYNLVTEKFGNAGYSVINSVATDVEIIKATTSILTLLLSSSQLVSINKQFDKKLSREEAIKNERIRLKNQASGVIDAIMDSGLLNVPIEIYTPDDIDDEDYE